MGQRNFRHPGLFFPALSHEQYTIECRFRHGKCTDHRVSDQRAIHTKISADELASTISTILDFHQIGQEALTLDIRPFRLAEGY